MEAGRPPWTIVIREDDMLIVYDNSQIRQRTLTFMNNKTVVIVEELTEAAEMTSIMSYCSLYDIPPRAAKNEFSHRCQDIVLCRDQLDDFLEELYLEINEAKDELQSYVAALKVEIGAHHFEVSREDDMLIAYDDYQIRQRNVQNNKTVVVIVELTELLRWLVSCRIVILLGLPFLLSFPIEYLSGAFNLGRVFIHFWSVNFKFVPEDVFVSKEFAVGLLIVHLSLLAAFTHHRWCKFKAGSDTPMLLSKIVKMTSASNKQAIDRLKPYHLLKLLCRVTLVSVDPMPDVARLAESCIRFNKVEVVCIPINGGDANLHDLEFPEHNIVLGNGMSISFISRRIFHYSVMKG
ncbi:hypothetical protein GIB67_039456 [Kingdonia uniflora]|uniref:dolichyl-P-Man:Man5GlcNAc2-PP-dolichol alpha-1,3-mannosyltransferase n=1 Tax=Kingdonia uniflora TaxID=39325 RepID=A0A7J7LIW2_9MAGN|nr:hypothetical protein GIB67_039456 [Kingdonia uniflora]